MTTKTRTRHPRITFAGVEFAARQWENSPAIHTVTRTALKKIFREAGDKLIARCEGSYTDDFAWDAANNYGKGEVPPACVLGFALDCPKTVSVWIDIEKNEISVVASWKSYRISTIGRAAAEAIPNPHAEEIARIEALIA